MVDADVKNAWNGLLKIMRIQIFVFDIQGTVHRDIFL